MSSKKIGAIHQSYYIYIEKKLKKEYFDCKLTQNQNLYWISLETFYTLILLQFVQVAPSYCLSSSPMAIIECWYSHRSIFCFYLLTHTYSGNSYVLLYIFISIYIQTPMNIYPWMSHVQNSNHKPSQIKVVTNLKILIISWPSCFSFMPTATITFIPDLTYFSTLCYSYILVFRSSLWLSSNLSLTIFLRLS